MNMQDQILEAFRVSGKTRLTTSQISELTGLTRKQVGSAIYRVIQAEVGLTNSIVRGKPRKGTYDYVQPNPKAEAPTVKAAEPPSDYLMLRIVAEVEDGKMIAVEEDSRRACKLEWL